MFYFTRNHGLSRVFYLVVFPVLFLYSFSQSLVLIITKYKDVLRHETYGIGMPRVSFYSNRIVAVLSDRVPKL